MDSTFVRHNTSTYMGGKINFKYFKQINLLYLRERVSGKLVPRNRN